MSSCGSRGVRPARRSVTKLPDRVRRRRAAGQEVVDLHHLVQRVHLVERQRQLGIVGNPARLAGSPRSHRPPAGSPRRSRWLRCAGRPPLTAQAPMATSILQLTRNSRSTCTFSALQTPPSMMPMSQRPQCLMSVSGERSNSTSSSELEQALVDVEKRHVAAEAAGERGRGDAQLASASRASSMACSRRAAARPPAPGGADRLAGRTCACRSARRSLRPCAG